MHLLSIDRITSIIEPQLLQPLEIIDGLAFPETLHNIPIVDILRNECHYLLPLEGVDIIATDLLHQLVQLGHIGIVPLLDITLVRIFEVAFCDIGPHYAVHHQHHLAGVGLHPLDSLHAALHVLLERVADY